MFAFLRLTTMAILASLSVAAAAAVPGKMNFQGYLTTAAGAPISGTLSITFTLYDTPASGTAIWQETQSVTASGGVYSVVLGASTPIDAPVILPSGQLWLGIKVGSDAEMTPRQQVLAVGYSIRSAVADLAASVPGTGITGTVPFAALPVGTGAGTVAAGNDARFADSRPVGSVPRTNTNSLVDASGSTGFSTSITIGSDGLPVISYLDYSGSGTLKVAKCGDAACSTGNSLATVAFGGSASGPTSIAIGTDGLPVIAYVDASAGDLRVAKCGNVTCSSANTIAVVDPGGAVTQRYQWAALAMGTDGLPVISYTDNSLGDLKVAKCGNPGCSSGNSIATVDAAGSTGYYTAIAVAADGLPVISYGSQFGTLFVAKCGNASCTSGNTSSTVDAVSAEVTSIAIGSDGLPVIAYHAGPTQDLKVAKCGNPACDSGNVIATVDSVGNVGEESSIAIGSDGLPIVSYRDGTNLHLKVVKCGNASCSANNFITTLATGAQYGRFSSITIGADGLPIVSFPELDSYDLRVIKCANAFCANNFTRR